MNNIYDSREFDLNVLEFLRQNTRLGPISMLKIKRAKIEAERYRKWYLKNEGELLESDYTAAEELEYELRLKAWEHYFEKDWKKNPDGLGLSEYAAMALEQQMSISNGRGR